jgi:hypothetical protein
VAKVQLSQFFRRGVLRPLDDCAARQLAALRIDSAIRVEWLQVFSDDEFGSIWESGVLQRINQACGIEISDYEETELPANRIEDALRAIRCDAGYGGSVSTFFQKLDALLCEALAAKRNVYFVF